METPEAPQTSRRGRGRRAWPLVIACQAALAASCGEDPLADAVWFEKPPEPAPSETPGLVLVWSDEFDGTALDASKWASVDGQRYKGTSTPDALDVRDGLLTITTYTASDGRHMTGYVSTRGGRFETTYGYFEARIRFTGAAGTWCAWWINTPTFGDPPDDIQRAGVEMDFEHRAFDTDGNQGIRNQIQIALNWKTDRIHTVSRVVSLPQRAPINGEWHTFAFRWTDKDVTFLVDEVALANTDVAVSKRPEYLNLSCHVNDGGWTWRVPDGGYGPKATSPVKMEVDWVRVWQQVP